MAQTNKWALGIALLMFVSTGSAGVVEESLQEANKLWDKTVEYADTALQQTQKLWREQHAGDARMWDDLIPHLDDVLTLQNRQAELPESSWFGKDQASNNAKIADLLDEAAGILIENNSLRVEARQITRAMNDNLETITELKRRKLAAPSDSLWRKTVQDIDEEIAERQNLLEEQRQELQRIRVVTAAELQAKGLDIDAEGLEFLLSTVVGDDVVDMTLAFLQVRRLTEQLETLTSNSQEDLATARRYYGMYTVLLRVLDRMHETVILGIETDYLPQITALGKSAWELRKQTRKLQSQAPSEVLRSNLAAQRLTIDAAQRYADYLRHQKQQVVSSRTKLSRDLAVAQNTYDTVRISGDLVALMRDSQELLDRLFGLQIPSLRVFENIEMKREFQRLTVNLRENTRT